MHVARTAAILDALQQNAKALDTLEPRRVSECAYSPRRLPVELAATQALVLDGICQTSELGELASTRRMASLEAIARRHHEGNLVEDVTETFLYAWAFVDAVDRRRQLVKMAPGFTTVPRSNGE